MHRQSEDSSVIMEQRRRWIELNSVNRNLTINVTVRTINDNRYDRSKWLQLSQQSDNEKKAFPFL